MMRFTVPGPPVGKARARTVLSRGRVHSYTPNKTTAYESTVRLAFTAAYPGHVPLDGPLAVSVRAFFWPPDRYRHQTGIESIPHTTRPDGDNVLKAVADAGNGVIWRDDSIVARWTIEKWYSLTPRVEVEIHHHEQAGVPG